METNELSPEEKKRAEFDDWVKQREEFDKGAVQQSTVSFNTYERPSWLARNISPIVAIIVTLAVFGFFYLIAFNKSGAIKGLSNEVTLMIVGGLISTLTQVMQFYFGASHKR